MIGNNSNKKILIVAIIIILSICITTMAIILNNNKLELNKFFYAKNLKNNAENELSDIETVTAETIAQNPSKYYGKVVKNYVSKNGVSDWKIFYSDGNHIFLIASDYIDLSYSSRIDQNTKMSTKFKYNAYWENVPDMQIVSSDVKNLYLTTGYELNSNKDSSKSVSTLLNTSNWENYMDNSGMAMSAIGSPTIEMWMRSWNNLYKDIDGELYCNKTGSNGYYIGTKSQPSTYNLSSRVMRNKNGYNNTLYYPHKEVLNSTNYYWIASPTEEMDNSLFMVNCEGEITSYEIEKDEVGLRPVVAIKENKTVNIEKNTVNVENIALNKSTTTLKVGETEKLIATITPENASNKKITWESDNKNAAIVDENGNITAIGKGMAIITATTEDGKKKAKITVNVEENTITNIQTITLDKNGGLDGNPTKLYVSDGVAYSNESCTTEITKVTIPTRSGYEFTKFESPYGDEIIDNKGNIISDAIRGIWTGTSKDYTASAQWEKLQNVSINANGGTGGTSIIYVGSLAVYSDPYGKTSITKIIMPTKTGYSAIDSGNIYKDGSINVSALITRRGQMGTENNITETISWTGNTYTVTYNYNDATGGKTETSKKVTYNGQYEVLPNPTRAYTISFDSNGGTSCGDQTATWNFDGWYSTVGNIKITADTQVTTVGNHTLNASWTGGTINLPTPTKAGYTFTGWNTEENGTGTTVNSSTQFVENTKLYAVWEEENTDITKPEITSVLGEKDSNGNYKVVIKATDESGIKKVTVNETEITTKDEQENYYFIPTENGTYKIEVYNTKDNKAEYTYTETNILKETKITEEKDSGENNVVYIETITNKEVEEVKINETEITQRDETGRYVFKPTANGKYTVTVTFKDGTTESKEYEETRFTSSDDEDNNGGNGNSGNNNSGNNNNGSNNNGSNNSGNSGSSSNGVSNNSSNLSGNGTTSGESGTKGNSISTSTALTTLPKTGTKLGALYAIIASGISAVFAWFKSKKIK